MKKTALISGVTKGIGRALAEKLLQENYRVLGCARTPESDIQNPDFQFFPVDLSHTESVNVWAEKLLQEEEKIDVLINNAAQFLPENLASGSVEILEKMIQVNLLAAYQLTQKVLPLLKKSSSPYIFNISSLAGINPYPASLYSVSKFAFQGLHENMVREFSDEKIKVTAILPGNVLTPSWGENPPKELRFVMPEDIAKMVSSILTLSEFAHVESLIIKPL